MTGDLLAKVKVKIELNDKRRELERMVRYLNERGGCNTIAERLEEIAIEFLTELSEK